MPEFVRKLQKEARFFVFSRSMLALSAGLLIWPSLVYLTDLYDLFFPIMEADAGIWLLFLSVITLVSIFSLLLFFWIRKPQTSQLAKQIESAHPDLMDTLNCAVEIDRKGKDNLSFMELRVLRWANEKVSKVIWGKGTRPSGVFWASLVAGFVFGGVLSAWSFDSSPVRKALDAHSGEPGLDVFTSKAGADEMGFFGATDEFTRGADISVFADVTRGHRGIKKALIEFKDESGETNTMEMLATPTLGRFEFVVPSLNEVFDYRVVTPSLASDWHCLIPYDPPPWKALHGKSLRPLILSRRSFEHDAFGYIGSLKAVKSIWFWRLLNYLKG